MKQKIELELQYLKLGNGKIAIDMKKGAMELSPMNLKNVLSELRRQDIPRKLCGMRETISLEISNSNITAVLLPANDYGEKSFKERFLQDYNYIVV